MVKLLMIADDFTGALDTGVQFAKRGICTQIFTKQKLEDADVRPETEVLVVDTESRPMEKAKAYEAVHEQNHSEQLSPQYRLLFWTSLP